MADKCESHGKDVDIAAGNYFSGLWTPDDEDEKVKAILDLLKALGVSHKDLCKTDKGCTDAGKPKCMPTALKISGTDAEFGIAEVELSHKAQKLYVLRILKATSITISPTCGCVKA